MKNRRASFVARRLVLALALFAGTFDAAAAQADSLWLGRARSSLDAANLLPFDQALGLYVTIPKLDPTNDEVVFGAGAGQTGAQSVYSLISTGSGFDAAVIKAAPGRFYGIAGLHNIDDSTRVIKIYDKATAPDPSSCSGGNSDCSKFRFILSPQTVTGAIQNQATMIAGGAAMANGISIVCVATIVDTNETSCQSALVGATILYKHRPNARPALLLHTPEPCPLRGFPKALPLKCAA